MTKQLKCGQEVTTKLGSISGMITAKLHRFKDVQYEVTFAKDGEHATIWMHREEIDLKKETIGIGFKNGKK